MDQDLVKRSWSISITVKNDFCPGSGSRCLLQLGRGEDETTQTQNLNADIVKKQ